MHLSLCTLQLYVYVYIYIYIHHSLYSYTFPMVYPFQYRVYICIHEVRRIGTWLVDSQKEPKHRRSHSQPTMLKRHFLVTSSNLTLKVTANGWVLCKCPELSLMNVLFVYLFPSFRIYVHGDVPGFSCEMIAKDPSHPRPKRMIWSRCSFMF